MKVLYMIASATIFSQTTGLDLETSDKQAKDRVNSQEYFFTKDKLVDMITNALLPGEEHFRNQKVEQFYACMNVRYLL